MDERRWNFVSLNDPELSGPCLAIAWLLEVTHIPDSASLSLQCYIHLYSCGCSRAFFLKEK